MDAIGRTCLLGHNGPADGACLRLNVGPRRPAHGAVTDERRFQVLPDGLRLSAAMTNRQSGPQPCEPVLRAALDLGDGEAVAIKLGDAAWQLLEVPADQRVATKSFRPTGQVTLTSPATGQACELRFTTPIDRLVVQADAGRSGVKVFAAPPATSLAPGEQRLAGVDLVPLAKVTGLPPLQPAGAHTAGRIVLDDCFLPCGQPGVWGAPVADPEAPDGFALKLFNTHFEWCLQWFVQPELFEPGARYTARALIRVAKTGREGKAFWAGVYDNGRSKGWGGIEPLTSAVKDGYQWYDLATWLPEPNQYVWAGPGMWDKKAGGQSAHEGVFVAKFEFVKVT